MAFWADCLDSGKCVFIEGLVANSCALCMCLGECAFPLPGHGSHGGEKNVLFETGGAQ